MTIFALSSGAGRSAVAVIRISGPETSVVLKSLTGAPPPPARTAKLCSLVDPDTGGRLDQALVLWFPGPRSFTGEDVAELQVHGGAAVVKAVIDTLSKQPRLRLAEPGEFTRRAFDNGRLDLTEVEGLADLIGAETEAQRRQALRQTEGELGALYNGWRNDLVAALARLEAFIDFPDEGLPAYLDQQVFAQIRGVVKELAQHVAKGDRGQRIREGFRVSILGAPNVGKSSLLNCLTQREAAIVSEAAGTTRDVIEVFLDLGGYAVSISDTAGLRTAAGEIEAEGVRRALASAERSDLKILLFDAETWPTKDPASLHLLDDQSVVAVNKIDRRPDLDANYWSEQQVVALSVKNRWGLEELLDLIRQAVVSRLEGDGSLVFTRTRHRQALEECLDRLEQVKPGKAQELAAEDLRLAVRALGRITGRVDVEDLLDVVFAEFCIGK